MQAGARRPRDKAVCPGWFPPPWHCTVLPPPPPSGIHVPALPPIPLVSWDSPQGHGHSESKESAGDFYFSHKLPQRPRWRESWAISFGTGGGEDTRRKSHRNKSACPFLPPPAPTTSLIRTCCALSYTRVPDAALKPILRGVLTAMTHHCLPSPALVLTRHGGHFLCPISACWAGVGGGGGVWGPGAEEAPSPSKEATAKCSLSPGLAFPAGTRRRWSVAQKGAPVLV